MTASCAALPAGATCYLERAGNLTGVRVACASVPAAFVAGGGPALDARLYAGHWARGRPAQAQAQEEFAAAYDLRDSGWGRLRAAVHYNDTTNLNGFSAASFTAVPALLRLTAPVEAVLRAFVNARAAAGGGGEVVAGMVGLVEMPRGPSFLALDLG